MSILVKHQFDRPGMTAACDLVLNIITTGYKQQGQRDRQENSRQKAHGI
jgi:hypothetical protein